MAKKKILIPSINNLIDLDDLSNSNLIKATKEFYNFPDHLHDFKIKDNTKHYVEIEFYNYQKTRCSIVYQKEFNTIKLNKGIGGVNHDNIKLVNNLVSFGIWKIK